MNAMQHCVCELKPSVHESEKLRENLVSVTENGEADVISAGCTKTVKAKLHCFTLIKHVSMYQIWKINRCNSIQIWRNSHHLTFGKWGQVIDWIIYESNYSLKGTRFPHGASRHERCVFSGGINQLMFRQLRVTLASKIPELHLTARHRCAKLIELFFKTMFNSLRMTQWSILWLTLTVKAAEKKKLTPSDIKHILFYSHFATRVINQSSEISWNQEFKSFSPLSWCSLCS